MKFYEIDTLPFDKPVITQGWIRFIRIPGKMAFLQCFDGTSQEDIQIVIPKSQAPSLKRGDYVTIDSVKVPSKGTQVYELLASKIEVISSSGDFTMEKKMLH